MTYHTPAARKQTDILFFLVTLGLIAGVCFSWVVRDIKALTGFSPADVLQKKDFANYWLAACEILKGHGRSIFDAAHYQDLANVYYGDARPDVMRWSYPPHYALLMAPLGLFGYPVAYLVFEIAGLGFFLYTLHLFARRHSLSHLRFAVLCALPALVINFIFGQNGFWVSGLTLLFFSLQGLRPVLSGIVLGTLTVKPQLFILFPVFLLLEKDFRTFISAALTVFAWGLVSTAVFGFDAWAGYISSTLAAQLDVVVDSYRSFLTMMLTVYGALQLLHVSAAMALMAQAVFSLGIMYAYLKTAPRLATLFEKQTFVLLACFLVTPYALMYDVCGLVAVFALFARTAEDKNEKSLLPLAAFAVSLVPTLFWVVAYLGAPLQAGLLCAAFACFVYEADGKEKAV